MNNIIFFVNKVLEREDIIFLMYSCFKLNIYCIKSILYENTKSINHFH